MLRNTEELGDDRAAWFPGSQTQVSHILGFFLAEEKENWEAAAQNQRTEVHGASKDKQPG